MREFDILKCNNTHSPKYYLLYSTRDSKKPIQAYFVCENCMNSPLYNNSNSIIHIEELKPGNRISIPSLKELKYPEDFPAEFLKFRRGVYID